MVEEVAVEVVVLLVEELVVETFVLAALRRIQGPD